MNNRINDIRQKYEAWVEKNKKLFQDLIADPFMVDTQHKYMDWLVYTLQKQLVDLPFSGIISILKRFNEVCNKLDRKSIESYADLYDVQNAVNAHVDTLEKKEGLELEAEKIRQKEKKSDNPAEEFYTYLEFTEAMEEHVVETYPKTFTVNEYEVNGEYDGDEQGKIRLFYTIPYYHCMVHMDIHLFDEDSPVSFTIQELTSNNKYKTHRIPFSKTVFKDSNTAFSLLRRDIGGPENCLKMLEFSLALFLESPLFKQKFSVEYVFVDVLPDSGAVHKILDYIKGKEERGAPATKYDYVRKHLNRPDNVRRFQNDTFNALRAAKIIAIDKHETGYTFRLGKNYLAFMEGRVKV